MNDRWEVFDYETQRVIATWWCEPDEDVKALLTRFGYWVRPHQFNHINQQDAYFG